jgi:hypothetical protein
MPKKPKFEKLNISALRRGEIRFATAYSAPEAAKIATKMARQGWRVEVQAWGSGHVKMKCEPDWKYPNRGRGENRKHDIARCTMKPAFKKQLKRR